MLVVNDVTQELKKYQLPGPKEYAFPEPEEYDIFYALCKSPRNVDEC